jgi:hypothetical protein
MKNIRKIVRQGDVLLVAVTAGLDQSRPVARERGRVVLAHGEVTGHAHTIAEADVTLAVLDDRSAMASVARALLASVGLTMEVRDEEVVGVLSTPTGARLTHEEHAPITLDPLSHYVVLRQREYAPESIRQVLD